MIELKRILIPTDFSEFSQEAIRYGCELAKKFSAELHFIHVAQDAFPLAPEAGMLSVPHGEYMAHLIATSERMLQNVPDPAIYQGPVAARVIEVGVPFLEIIRYAREHDIDLIVLATHGRTGIVHMLMGSVAEKVVRKAPCPVLTIHPEGHDFIKP
jgi:nucleotide-binding universal stress UspA family protein